MTDRVLIQRRANVDLEFTGHLLAEATTDDGLDWWDEWRIWTIAPDNPASQNRWVVQHIRATRLPGVDDQPEAWLCKTPVDVRKALRVPDDDEPGGWLMPDDAFDMLADAAERDPRLDEALVQRI
jgi:hypothetical protein